MKKLAKKIGLRIESVMVSEHPSCPDQKDAHHFKVTLFRNGPRKQLTTYFSMGYPQSKDPEAVAVLDCLISDAQSVECAQGFEDWAVGLGYDPDSRKAERTYKACEAMGVKVQQFLGNDWEEAVNSERL